MLKYILYYFYKIASNMIIPFKVIDTMYVIIEFVDC